MIDPVIVDSLRLALALLFASSLAHKLRDRGAFGRIVEDYELMPRAFAPSAGNALMFGEALLVPLLIVPDTAPTASVAAAGLIALYSGAISINLWRGRRDIECGCGGPAGARLLDASLLLRNALLLGLCLVASIEASARPLFWLDRVTIVFSVAALSLAYYAASLLAATNRNPFARPVAPATPGRISR